MIGFDLGPLNERTPPATPDEIASAPTVAGAAGISAPRDEGELVMPVPQGAPPMPAFHPKYGKPTGRWHYHDPNGAVLFTVYRFDPPGDRKQFSPLTLWRCDDGKLQWRWKSVPAPRPLYGLNWLVPSVDASVVICEGEKSADAADKVFPDCACITSPNGAESATKADWTSLKGRKV